MRTRYYPMTTNQKTFIIKFIEVIINFFFLMIMIISLIGN